MGERKIKLPGITDDVLAKSFDKLIEKATEAKKETDQLVSSGENAVKSLENTADTVSTAVEKTANRATKAVKEINKTVRETVTQINRLNNMKIGVKNGKSVNPYSSAYANLLDEDQLKTLKANEKKYNKLLESVKNTINDYRDFVKKTQNEFETYEGNGSTEPLVKGLYDINAVEDSAKKYIAKLKENNVKINNQIKNDIIYREKAFDAYNTVKKQGSKIGTPKTVDDMKSLLEIMSKQIILAKKIKSLTNNIGYSDSRFDEIDLTKIEETTRQYFTKAYTGKSGNEYINKFFGSLVDTVETEYNSFNKKMEKFENNRDFSGFLKIPVEDVKKDVDDTIKEFKKVETYVKKLDKLTTNSFTGKGRSAFYNLNKLSDSNIKEEAKWSLVGQMSSLLAQGGKVNKEKSGYKYYEKLLNESEEFSNFSKEVQAQVKANMESVWKETEKIPVPKGTQNQADAVSNLEEAVSSFITTVSRLENYSQSDPQWITDYTDKIRKGEIDLSTALDEYKNKLTTKIQEIADEKERNRINNEQAALFTKEFGSVDDLDSNKLNKYTEILNQISSGALSAADGIEQFKKVLDSTSKSTSGLDTIKEYIRESEEIFGAKKATNIDELYAMYQNMKAYQRSIEDHPNTEFAREARKFQEEIVALNPQLERFLSNWERLTKSKFKEAFGSAFETTTLPSTTHTIEQIESIHSLYEELYDKPSLHNMGIDINFAEDYEGSLNRIVKRLKEIYKLRNESNFSDYHNEIVSLIDIAKGAGMWSKEGFGEGIDIDKINNLTKAQEKFFLESDRFKDANILLSEMADHYSRIGENAEKSSASMQLTPELEAQVAGYEELAKNIQETSNVRKQAMQTEEEDLAIMRELSEVQAELAKPVTVQGATDQIKSQEEGLKSLLNELKLLQDTAKNGKSYILPQYYNNILQDHYGGQIRQNSTTKKSITDAIRYYNDINNDIKSNGYDIYTGNALKLALDDLAKYVAGYKNLDEAQSLFGKKNKDLWEQVIDTINRAKAAKEAYETYDAKQYKLLMFLNTDVMKFGDYWKVENYLKNEDTESAFNYLIDKYGLVEQASNESANQQIKATEKVIEANNQEINSNEEVIASEEKKRKYRVANRENVPRLKTTSNTTASLIEQAQAAEEVVKANNDIIKSEQQIERQSKQLAKQLAAMYSVVNPETINKVAGMLLEKFNNTESLKVDENGFIIADNILDEFDLFASAPPSFESIFDVLAKDADFFIEKAEGASDEYKKLRDYVTHSKILIDSKLKNEFGDKKEWDRIRTTIGMNTMTTNEKIGTPINNYLEELNKQLGTTFDITTSAQDGVRQLSDELIRGRNGISQLDEQIKNREIQNIEEVTNTFIANQNKIDKLNGKKLSAPNPRIHQIKQETEAVKEQIPVIKEQTQAVIENTNAKKTLNRENNSRKRSESSLFDNNGKEVARNEVYQTGIGQRRIVSHRFTEDKDGMSIDMTTVKTTADYDKILSKCLDHWKNIVNIRKEMSQYDAKDSSYYKALENKLNVEKQFFKEAMAEKNQFRLDPEVKAYSDKKINDVMTSTLSSADVKDSKAVVKAEKQKQKAVENTNEALRQQLERIKNIDAKINDPKNNINNINDIETLAYAKNEALNKIFSLKGNSKATKADIGEVKNIVNEYERITNNIIKATQLSSKQISSDDNIVRIETLITDITKLIEKTKEYAGTSTDIDNMIKSLEKEQETLKKTSAILQGKAKDANGNILSMSSQDASDKYYSALSDYKKNSTLFNRLKIEQDNKEKQKAQDYQFLIDKINELTAARKKLQSLESNARKNPTLDYSAEIQQQKDLIQTLERVVELNKVDFNTMSSDGDFWNVDRINKYTDALNKAETAEKDLNNQRQLFSEKDQQAAIEDYKKALSDLEKAYKSFASNANGKGNLSIQIDYQKIAEAQQRVKELGKSAMEAGVSASDLEKLFANSFREISSSAATEGVKTLDEYRNKINTLSEKMEENGTATDKTRDRLKGLKEAISSIIQNADFSNNEGLGKFLSQVDQFGIKLRPILSEIETTGKLDSKMLSIEGSIKDFDKLNLQTIKAKSLLTNLKDEYKSLQDSLANNNGKFGKDQVTQLQRIEALVKKINQEAYGKGTLLPETAGNITDIKSLEAAMTKYASAEWNAVQIGRILNNGSNELTGTFKAEDGTIHKLTATMNSLHNGMNIVKNTTSQSVGFFTEMGNVIKTTASRFSYMFSGYMMFHRIISAFRDGLNVLKDYDSALTTISYTMDLTKKQLNNLGDSAVQMAKDLSMSLDNAMSIYQIYANMNTTAKEINETAMPTAILSNLSGVDTATASDQVQGILQQFSMLKNGADSAADASMHVVDTLDKISASVAIDYAKGIGVITDAVTATGQVAYDAGLSFEQLAAISAKVAERTREDGSTIGGNIVIFSASIYRNIYK